MGKCHIEISITWINTDTHYPRCYAKPSPFASEKKWEKELNDIGVYWDFEQWIIKEFKNEYIPHEFHKRMGKIDVLCVSLKEDLSTEEFFYLRGKLGKYYNENRMDDVFEMFLLNSI